MRIIFSGLFSHAAQLLQEFESKIGLDSSLRTVMAGIAKKLPEVRLANFSGDSTLPRSVRPVKNQRYNYCSPTMHINTSQAGGSVQVVGIPGRLDVSGTVGTVVKSGLSKPLTVGPKSKTDVSVLLPGCSFKSQRDFRYNTLEFLQHDAISDDGKGIFIEVSLRDREMCLLQITVHETKAHDKAYVFARKLAKRLPKVNIEYRSDGLPKGWETIQQAWEWNAAKPYFVTAKHRNAARRIEKALKPYKKLVVPYLDANDLSEDSGLAGSVYGNMETLYEQGIRNPVLLVNFSIILGHVGMMALGTLVIPGIAFSKGFDIESKVTSDVHRIAEEVSKLDIGIRTSFWKRRLSPRSNLLPKQSFVAETLIRMFNTFGKDKGGKVKQLHDEFNKMFPIAIAA